MIRALDISTPYERADFIEGLPLAWRARLLQEIPGAQCADTLAVMTAEDCAGCLAGMSFEARESAVSKMDPGMQSTVRQQLSALLHTQLEYEVFEEFGVRSMMVQVGMSEDEFSQWSDAAAVAGIMAKLTPEEASQARTSGLVYFYPLEIVAEEYEKKAVITLRRSVGSEGEVVATVVTRDGTAVSGVDYTFHTQSVVWADGDTSGRQIIVPIVDDELQEDNETFYVDLKCTGAVTHAMGSTATVLIIDSSEHREHTDKVALEADKMVKKKIQIPEDWEDFLGEECEGLIKKGERSGKLRDIKLRGLIVSCYRQKFSLDQYLEKDWTLHKTVVDYYESTYGVKELARQKLAKLIASAKHYYKVRNDSLICAFIRMTGLYDGVEPRVVNAYLDAAGIVSAVWVPPKAPPSLSIEKRTAIFWTLWETGKGVNLTTNDQAKCLRACLKDHDVDPKEAHKRLAQWLKEKPELLPAWRKAEMEPGSCTLGRFLTFIVIELTEVDLTVASTSPDG